MERPERGAHPGRAGNLPARTNDIEAGSSERRNALTPATAPFASAGKGVHRGTTRVCAWIQGRCRSRTLAGPATFG